MSARIITADILAFERTLRRVNAADPRLDTSTLTCVRRSRGLFGQPPSILHILRVVAAIMDANRCDEAPEPDASSGFRSFEGGHS